MKVKPDTITVRISPELRAHLVSLGPTSSVVRAFILLGLERLGCDISDVYREMFLLSVDVAHSSLQAFLSESAGWWSANADHHPATLQPAFTQAEWRALCADYGQRCVCCGQEALLTPDHIVPRSKGGSLDITNIQPLCMSCNSRKGVQSTDYRPEDRK